MNHLCLSIIFILIDVGCLRVVSDRFELQYDVKEEVDSPYSFGNLLIDSGLNMLWNRSVQMRLSFNILKTSLTRSDEIFFHVDQKGLLRVIARLDRDVLCPRKLLCEETIMISTNPINYAKLFQITIRILDINDQSPTFPNKKEIISILETSNIGALLELPLAIDMDAGKNGVQQYSLIEATNTFELIWNSNVHELKLQLLRQLDRESQSNYSFTLVANDGGTPKLSGILNIVVNIADANDNPPCFSKRIFTKIVPEDLPIKSIILRVDASDEDSGANAKLIYSIRFSASDYVKRMFSIDRNSGTLRLENMLDYEFIKVIEIPVEVQDSPSVGGILSDHAIIRIQIEDRNDQLPIINVVSQSGKDQVHVLENSAVGMIVAYIFVTDQDSGLGGEVLCSADSMNFHLEEIDQSQGQSQYKLLTKKIFDRERNPIDSVHLHCSDKGTPSHWTSRKIAVIVDDMNDMTPKFITNNELTATYSSMIYENNEVWRPIVQVVAQDLDSDENGRISYFIQSEFRYLFHVSANGSVFSNEPLDREVAQFYKFFIFAKDFGVPPLTSSATIIINILDKNDFTPTFSNVLDFNVFENVTVGEQIGQIQAIDKDLLKAGQKGLKYIIQSDENNEIGAQCCQIDEYGRVFVQRNLNREAIDRYIFYVNAIDQGVPPLTGTGTVIIHVLDVNDNVPRWLYPRKANQLVTLSQAKFQRGQTLLHPLRAIDADRGINAEVTYWAIGGKAMKILELNSSTGIFTLRRSLKGADSGDYALHVEARDGGSPSHRAETIMIFRVNVTFLNNIEFLTQNENIINFVIVIVIVVLTLLLSCLLLLCIIKLHYYLHANNEDSRLRNYGDCFYSLADRISSLCVVDVIQENHTSKPVILCNSNTDEADNYVLHTTATRHYKKCVDMQHSCELERMVILPTTTMAAIRTPTCQPRRNSTTCSIRHHRSCTNCDSDHDGENNCNEHSNDYATTYISYTMDRYPYSSKSRDARCKTRQIDLKFSELAPTDWHIHKSIFVESPCVTI